MKQVSKFLSVRPKPLSAAGYPPILNILGPVVRDRIGHEGIVEINAEQLSAIALGHPTLRSAFDTVAANCNANNHLIGLQQKIFREALLTWIHIHSRTEADWFEDIVEYVDYGCHSFGGPDFYGKGEYLLCVKYLLEFGKEIMPISFPASPNGTYTIRQTDQCLSEEKLKKVVCHVIWCIDPSVSADDMARFEELITIFDNWFNSIPCELEPLKKLKQEWEEGKEIIKAGVFILGHFVGFRPNRYMDIPVRTGLTKEFVIEVINTLTDNLILNHSVLDIHNNSQLSDFDYTQTSVTLALQIKKQKILGLMSSVPDALEYEIRWSKWLKIQKNTLKALKPLYKSIELSKKTISRNQTDAAEKRKLVLKTERSDHLWETYFRLLEKDNPEKNGRYPFASRGKVNSILFRWFNIGEEPNKDADTSFSISGKELVKFLDTFIREIVNDRRRGAQTMQKLMSYAYKDFRSVFGDTSEENARKNYKKWTVKKIHRCLDWKNDRALKSMVENKNA